MAFSKKTWKDRISQYINRRLLTDSDGNTQQVTVTRDEGSVTEAGDAFSASNMNDLEDRIDTAFGALTASDIPYSAGVSVADKIDDISYTISTSVDSVTGVTWTCKKYNNGELEIYGSKYYTPATSIAFTAWGSLFATGFDIGTYPIAFYTPPTVIGQAQIENVACVSSTQATSNTTTAPQITCYRPTGATIETTYHINIGLYAHGRWKA